MHLLYNALLQDHVISRLTGCDYDPDEEQYANKERARLAFLINYTTYNMRRNQDSVNLRTHPDIMVLLQKDPNAAGRHPYW